MRIRVHLRTLWKHRWILATAMCAGAAMAIALAVRQPPVYLAEAQVFIAPDPEDGRGSGSGGEGAREEAELARYAAHVESLAMAQSVIRRESFDIAASELAGKVKADVLPEIRVVSVGVEDSDPSEAQSLATAFATAFVEEGVREVGTEDARASILEAAPLPEEPVSPKPLRDGYIGLGVGALAGIFLTFILKRPAPKSSKIKTRDALPQKPEPAAPSARKTPPRVDLKPAVRSKDEDLVPQDEGLVSEDEELDEEIEPPAMDEEKAAPPSKPQDPFAIYPATRTFHLEPDRSLVSTTAPKSDEDAISIRIREAVRRGMSAATPLERGPVEKLAEPERPTPRPDSTPSGPAAEAEEQPAASSDVIEPDVDYEDFWQMGREHDDSPDMEKPRNSNSKENPPKA